MIRSITCFFFGHDWRDRNVGTDWGYELWSLCHRCGKVNCL